MVLQDKWDRKAARERVRKFKAKGKELPEKRKARNNCSLRRDPTSDDRGDLVGDNESSDDGGSEREEAGDAGEHGSGGVVAAGGTDDTHIERDHAPGKFSRRKVLSNAWRYEDDETNPPADTYTKDAPVEEEPDYVALTRREEGQMKDENEIKAAQLDIQFLLDSRKAEGTRRAQGDELRLGKKGNIIKADRRDFLGITEKIARQSSADAFRARFAKAKPRSRAPAIVQGSAGGEETPDDVDVFLEELCLDGASGAAQNEVLGSTAAEARATSSQAGNLAGSSLLPTCPSKASGLPITVSQDDDWLDALLGR